MNNAPVTVQQPQQAAPPPTGGVAASSPQPALLPYALRRWRGPLTLIALTLLTLLLWLPVRPAFGKLDATLLSLADLCGLLSITVLSLNFILGARVSPIEQYFNGLDKLYRAHRATAIAGVVLVVVHFCLEVSRAAAKDPNTVTGVLFPAPASPVLEGSLALLGLVVICALLLSRRLRHEAFVAIHKLFGLVLLSVIVHAFRLPTSTGKSPLLAWYVGILATLAVLAWLYRSALGRWLVPRLEYAVAAVNPLDASVTEIVLRPASKRLRYQPGQFLFVSFGSPQLSDEPHPFSITSAPGADELKIVVKALGDFTRGITRLQVGDRARVEGPYGQLSYQRYGNPRQVWIAGGIGMTPFLSMARSLGADDDMRVDFYYCVQGDEQAYFLDEFFAQADLNPRLRVIPIRKTSLGRVTADDIVGVTRDIAAHEILLCGPPAMTANLRDQLRAHGVPDSRFHYEDFSFTD